MTTRKRLITKKAPKKTWLGGLGLGLGVGLGLGLGVGLGVGVELGLEGAEADHEQEVDLRDARPRYLQHVHEVHPALQRDALKDVGRREEDVVESGRARVRVGLHVLAHLVRVRVTVRVTVRVSLG